MRCQVMLAPSLEAPLPVAPAVFGVQIVGTQEGARPKSEIGHKNKTVGLVLTQLAHVKVACSALREGSGTRGVHGRSPRPSDVPQNKV